MMHYLVFDSRCPHCSHLAETIESATSGQLEAISIHDAKAIALLDQAYPQGWKFAPYLITVSQDKVDAKTGIGAALRLGWLLGPRKGWQIWSLAQQYGIFMPSSAKLVLTYDASRRRFVKYSLFSAIAAATVGKIFGYRSIVFAQSSEESASKNSQLLSQIKQVKVEQLTGTALNQELRKFQQLSEYEAATAFLAQNGSDTTPTVKGVRVSVLVGKKWTSFVHLTLSYGPSTSSFGGRLTLRETLAKTTVGLALNKDVAASVVDGYEVTGSSVQFVGKIERIGDRQQYTAVGQKPVMLNLRSRTAPNAAQSDAAQSDAAQSNSAQSCQTCSQLCTAALTYGCNFIGALIECSIVCGGPGNEPCVAICEAVLTIACSIGIKPDVCSGLCTFLGDCP